MACRFKIQSLKYFIHQFAVSCFSFFLFWAPWIPPLTILKLSLVICRLDWHILHFEIFLSAFIYNSDHILFLTKRPFTFHFSFQSYENSPCTPPAHFPVPINSYYDLNAIEKRLLTLYMVLLFIKWGGTCLRLLLSRVWRSNVSLRMHKSPSRRVFSEKKFAYYHCKKTCNIK